MRAKQPSQRPDIGAPREESRSWKAEAASQRVKYLSQRPGIDSLKGKLEVLRPKHGFVSIKSNGLCASPFIGVFLEKAFRRVQNNKTRAAKPPYRFLRLFFAYPPLRGDNIIRCSITPD